ncbi:MAG TPA: ROK family protein [Geobacteraceae bacterium]|nr:ROK family protein [Geobacteraceae bacterium]
MTRKAVVFGIDIGGTTTSFGYIERDGNCLAEKTFATMPREPAIFLVERLCREADEMFSPFLASHELKGIGIGAPNANYYTGTLQNPPNLDWEGTVPIAELFGSRFRLPVAVTNDANAAALGEMSYGAARGMRNFISITLGTGLGSGIVVNGAVVYGADGFAGELGHTVVDPEGRICACGKKGCLETYVSGPGLCRTVFSLLAERLEDSPLREYSFRELTAKDVYIAARDGDTLAGEAFAVTGRILGVKLADAVAHTSPEAFIFHGGLSSAGNLLLAPAHAAMEENLLGIYRGRIPLLLSELQDMNAGVLGAAALIWNELEKGVERTLS